MIYTIQKEFHFSASHSLPSLPSSHKCHHLHGHNYIVVVHLQSDVLNEHGFVVDYNALNDVKWYIDNVLDHKHLNDVLDVQTSAENIAEHLFNIAKKQLPETYKVSVSETPKTWAHYQP